MGGLPFFSLPTFLPPGHILCVCPGLIVKSSCTLYSVESMLRHVEDKVSFPFVFFPSTLCLVMNRDVFLRAGSEREGRHNRGAR